MLKTSIQTKSEIIQEMQAAYQAVHQYAADKDATAFRYSPDERWSVANQLEHLILSSKGVASVLKMPKQQLLALGKAENEPRNYDELYRLYKEVLKGGQKAPAKFCPNPDQLPDQEQLLANWKMIEEKLVVRMANWSEDELNDYYLPHPALGKLTVREMLFATIFHTHHHLDSMQGLFK